MEVEKKGSVLCQDLSLLECRFDECKNRLRGLFNQVLVKYLEGKNVHKSIKPLPALCSNEKPVDLFKLFWVVRKVGGYESTSRQDLWDFVAEECGIGFGAMASVKLMYTKYLSELDRWLWQGVRDREISNGGGNRVVKNLEETLQDLMKEFGDSENGLWKEGMSDVKVVISEIGNSGDESDSTKRSVDCSSGKDLNEKFDGLEERYINDNDDEQIYIDSDNNLVISIKQVIEEVISGVHGFSEGRSKIKEEDFNLSSDDRVGQVNDARKRKREHSSWANMLSWVKGAAKCSDDIGIGGIPDTLKWKDHGSEELWVQALLAREALLIKRHVYLSVETSPQQKNWKMHPSMYEDVSKNLSVEKSRSSLRLQPVNLASCGTDVIQSTPEESPLPSVDVASGDTVRSGVPGKAAEKKIRVGPCFQAEIPEWTGEVSESDSKWVETLVWLPEGGIHKPTLECDPIGKGRPRTCRCLFSGHIECIRFHIAEKRLTLNRELGQAFYKWRFQLMGEEVSLSWTVEEEQRFKRMVQGNKSTWNQFWRHSFKIFPSKTREELVSYYFNVFIIRRRSYQNRVSPLDVDSDNDEKEVGAVGIWFGCKAVQVPECSLPVCTENKQCFKLE